MGLYLLLKAVLCCWQGALSVPAENNAAEGTVQVDGLFHPWD